MQARRLLISNGRVSPMFLPICHLVLKFRRQTLGFGVLCSFASRACALIFGVDFSRRRLGQKRRANDCGTSMRKGLEEGGMQNLLCLARGQRLRSSCSDKFSPLRPLESFNFSNLTKFQSAYLPSLFKGLGACFCSLLRSFKGFCCRRSCFLS